MKVIDLLNKIANGDINEDIKIEFKNGYNYEYCTIREFFDRYILDKENLNQEITLEDTPKEENKIPEKLETYKDKNNDIFLDNLCYKYMPMHKDSLSSNEQVIVDKINEIIDYLESKGE